MQYQQLQFEKEVMSPQTCQRCGNQYLVIWLTKGGDYNDFGERYCPYCGQITELFHIPAE